MQISLLLIQQIAQLFLILLMGYAVVRTGLLKASDSKVLSVVFVYLVMPCVVLNAFQIKDTPEIRTGLLYSMGIAVGMHVVFLLLNALFRKVLKLDAVEQVNIIYSNAAALVIPIGKTFGSIENPLLVSVRSGARQSMPGMMDTILNLGLNDEAVEGLAQKGLME